MTIRKINLLPRDIPLVLSLFMAFFLLAGCETSSSGNVNQPRSTSSSTHASSATSTQSTLASASTTHLTGPTNFIINNALNFSNASGTGFANGVTHQLSAAVVERSVTSDMRHTLFKVDSSTHVMIYTNYAPPMQAQVGQNADEGTTIQYMRSAKSGTTSFHATLAGNQMTTTYERSSITNATVNGQTFSGGSTSTATFTTQVSWVTDDQIPASPTNGKYQLTRIGGVALSWTPGTSGGAVKQYNVYRLVLTDPQGFQFLTSVSPTATSYTDTSAVAMNNAQTIAGMVYAIYAVGSSGVENPVDTEISISSLGQG